MEVKVKLLDPRATLPTRGSEEAAGADLRTLDALTVPAHQTVQVHIFGSFSCSLLQAL